MCMSSPFASFFLAAHFSLSSFLYHESTETTKTRKKTKQKRKQKLEEKQKNKIFLRDISLLLQCLRASEVSNFSSDFRNYDL